MFKVLRAFATIVALLTHMVAAQQAHAAMRVHSNAETCLTSASASNTARKQSDVEHRARHACGKCWSCCTAAQAVDRPPEIVRTIAQPRAAAVTLALERSVFAGDATPRARANPPRAPPVLS